MIIVKLTRKTCIIRFFFVPLRHENIYNVCVHLYQRHFKVNEIKFTIKILVMMIERLFKPLRIGKSLLGLLAMFVMLLAPQGAWAEDDRDLSHVMTVYADVNDGMLTIGAKSNGFFKIDDFKLTYLGDIPTTIADIPKDRPHSRAIYDLTGRKVSTVGHGVYIVDGKKVVY